MTESKIQRNRAQFKSNQSIYVVTRDEISLHMLSQRLMYKTLDNERKIKRNNGSKFVIDLEEGANEPGSWNKIL